MTHSYILIALTAEDGTVLGPILVRSVLPEPSVIGLIERAIENVKSRETYDSLDLENELERQGVIPLEYVQHTTRF